MNSLWIRTKYFESKHTRTRLQGRNIYFLTRKQHMYSQQITDKVKARNIEFQFQIFSGIADAKIMLMPGSNTAYQYVGTHAECEIFKNILNTSD